MGDAGTVENPGGVGGVEEVALDEEELEGSREGGRGTGVRGMVAEVADSGFGAACIVARRGKVDDGSGVRGDGEVDRGVKVAQLVRSARGHDRQPARGVEAE